PGDLHRYLTTLRAATPPHSRGVERPRSRQRPPDRTQAGEVPAGTAEPAAVRPGTAGGAGERRWGGQHMGGSSRRQRRGVPVNARRSRKARHASSVSSSTGPGSLESRTCTAPSPARASTQLPPLLWLERRNPTSTQWPFIWLC